MFRRKKKREVPGLNTTSTSDISFMLLIFFLVTTSMDSDRGLGRQLPPLEPDRQAEVQDVDRNMVMTIVLEGEGKVTVDDKEKMVDERLRKDIRHFIIEKGPRHIIELQVSRQADYDTYFHLQNQIVLAYKEIRNVAAEKKYGKSLSELGDDERNDILTFYPQRIQETAL